MSDDSFTRLNKFLALHQGISRRRADELIERGQVSVNGVIAELGAHIGPTDKVEVKGEPVSTETELVYLLLNKPAGYVSSRSAQGDSPTIYNLLPTELYYLKPVGRLDRDSSGLILLTNDGDFAQQMTHPSFYKIKKYDVTIDHPLQPLHHQMINDFGIDLEDGKSKLTLEKQSEDGTEWKVIMSEGRNRQIRRTFTALGYTVTALHRTDFGPYTLSDLQPGKYQTTKRI